jgi:hypothetical protein
VSVVQAAEVQIACDRLDEAQAEELRARARLTLHGVGTAVAPSLVRVECDATHAQLVWHGHSRATVAIDETHGLVEGALDAILWRLQLEQSSEVQPVPQGSMQASAADRQEARYERDSPREFEPAKPQASLQTGGIGLALSLERTPGSLALGPELDLGVGHEATAGGVSQALRLDPQDSTLITDSRLVLAYGAPFAPEHRLGIVAGVGIQGLSLLRREREADDAATAFTTVLALGIRGSVQTGQIALWAGVDACRRNAVLRLDTPEPIELPQWSVTAAFGAFWQAAGAVLQRGR